MSRAILTDILEAIEIFVGGAGDIAELQSRLEADASALDQSYSGLVYRLRNLDADLEEIRFARLRGEQRMAALTKLEPVREYVASALRESEH